MKITVNSNPQMIIEGEPHEIVAYFKGQKPSEANPSVTDLMERAVRAIESVSYPNGGRAYPHFGGTGLSSGDHK